ARLRVRSSGLDPQTARGRLASQLREARLAPGGLSERAVLCVRRVRDPRPGRLRLTSPDDSVPLDCEQAVRDQLDSVSQLAERPALCHVPSSAEAVLFADQTELLASLASDVCAGLAHGRWWWRIIYQTINLRSVLFESLRENPEPLPMLLQLLAERRQAVTFVESLTDDEVEVLLERLLTNFGLVRLRQALRSPAERLAMPPDTARPSSVVSLPPRRERQLQSVEV